MSYASQKGYRAEHDVLELLTRLGFRVDRPRTTSRANTDAGDIRGLPFVISVKNRTETRLSVWCDELARMVNRSRLVSGVVIHKRAGRGDPLDWYATMPVRQLIPFVLALVNEERRNPTGTPMPISVPDPMSEPARNRHPRRDATSDGTVVPRDSQTLPLPVSDIRRCI